MTATRVGVAFPGDPTDRTLRSGTPYGVYEGIKSLGLEAVAVNTTLPHRVDQVVAAADGAAAFARARLRGEDLSPMQAYRGGHVGARLARLRSTVARHRVTRTHLSDVVVLGTGYELPTGTRYVAYDDMTVVQAIEGGYPAWASARPTDRRFRVEQQRRVYQRAVACCMTTSWAARSVVEDYGVPAERVFVVGAGSHETPRTVERVWDVPRLLFVGLNWERKNGPRVLEAFTAVRRAHPDATLDVVGVHPEIDLPGVTTHGRLSRQVPEERDRLARLFDRATCFVMPSLHEPGGVVFTEAASTGLPSIGGSNGGSRDFIGDGGVVVDPLSTDEIIAAMDALCDPDRARRTGALAAAHAAKFTWPRVAARLAVPLVAGIDADPLPSTL